MIRTAAHSGAQAAVARFGLREASVLETVLSALGAGVGGSMAKGALNAASPRLMSALENAGAAPINAVRRAVSGPSPADLLVKHLGSTQPSMQTRPPIPAMVGAPSK